MLEKEITQREDAIETLFCQPFEKLPRSPMNDELGGMLLRLLFIKDAQNIPDKEKPFLYQVIEKRIEHCFTFKITDERLLLFLSVLTESPGQAIMYLTYLQYWCKKNDIRELTLDVFCSQIFPWGFPKEDDLRTLWEATKVDRGETLMGGSDNLLDYKTPLLSIQFNDQ